MVIQRAPSRYVQVHPRRAVALLDVLVAGIVLSGALVAILGVASQAITAQIRGQQLQEAAQVLDLIAAEILAMGPLDYPGKNPLAGVADSPFENYNYRIDIDNPSPGDAYKVSITVSWESSRGGRSVELNTFMAPRLGEEPDPERIPELPVERDLN